MDDPECLVLSEFEESVKYYSGAEGEADEGDRTHTKMALHEDVGEDASCCFGPIESIVPRIIDQISQFCQDWGNKMSENSRVE